MSAISQKSITGITSITTPAGVDNQLTLHNNNTTEAVKLDIAGNLHFHNHLNITGVSTASNFKTGTSNLHNTGLNVQDLDVDGHTNLDNVSIAGITTTTGNIEITKNHPAIQFNDSSDNPDYNIQNYDGKFLIYDSTNSATRLTVNTDGHIDVHGNLDARLDLDVDGHTNLDNVNIAGVTTFADNVSIIKSGGPILELCNNTNNTTMALRLHEGVAGSTANGGGMTYDGSANKLHITCGTNLTTKRITILRDDGKVGIGTDSPDQNLEVFKASGTNLVKVTSQANSTVGLEIEKTGATTQSWRIADGQTVNGALEFYDVTDSKRVMGIDGSGRVIIGSGNHAGGSQLVIKGGDINSYSTLGMFSEHTNPSNDTLLTQIRFGSNASAVGADIRAVADAAWGNNDYPTRLGFYTTPDSSNSRQERFRITSDGTVKIKEKLLILNGGGFSETAPAGLSIRNAGIYLEQGNEITWNNGDNSISGESGYHLSFKTYNGSSNTEKLQISGGSGNAGNWLKTTQPGAIFAYDVKSNNTSTCRPAAGDWVYVGNLGYGANKHGKFVVEWSNISSPGCCHHGYVILEAGTSYGAGYDYDWSESLKVLHFDAHNSDHFKAWKMVDHGNVLKVFGQWGGGSVASGTFYVTALTGDTYLGDCFYPATPVVDNNSYDGTRLTIDGTFQQGATGLNPSTKRMQGGSYYGMLHTYGGLDTYGALTTRGTGAGNGYFGTIWCNYGGISGSGKEAGSFTPYAGQVCPAGSGNRYIHVKLNITGGSMWMVEIMGYEYNGSWTSTVNGVSVTNDKIHHSISGGYHYNNNALFNGKAKAYRGVTPGWYISGGYICCYIDTTNTGTTNRHGFYKFAGGVDWIIGRSAQKPTNIIAYSYSGSTSDQF